MTELTTDTYAYLLEWAVFLPLICGAVLLVMKTEPEQLATNVIAAAGFFVPMGIALLLWYVFAGPGAGDLRDVGGFAFINFSEGKLGHDLGLAEPFGIPLGIRLAFGLNGVSLPLFVMAGIVGAAAGAYALRMHIAARRNLFLGLLLIMLGGLMGTFASIDIFFFYFFHELALIPTFILLGVWGGTHGRAYALEVTIYLTLGAMLTLVGLIGIYASAGEVTGLMTDPYTVLGAFVAEGQQPGFNMILLREYFREVPLDGDFFQQNLAAVLLLGFGILVSLFPLHSWAPKAYATAPTPNAMMHAGVLKKFGLYGLVQIAAPILPEGLAHWSQVLVWLALGNIIIIGFVTTAQRDLKRMVAYSSVMHMGYIFLGLAVMSQVGMGAAVMLMFAHGLSVALLLLLSDYIRERSGTLEMRRMGGLGPQAPVLSALFVGGIFASAGLPGFANFWGEFGVFVAIGEDGFAWALAPAALGIVISAIYGLRAVANIFFGPPTERLQQHLIAHPAKDLSLAERAPAFLLIGALIFVGFWPRSLSDKIDRDTPKPTGILNLHIGAAPDGPAAVRNLQTETSDES